MTGGTGADDFDFNTVAEIGKGATRDVIRDFAHLSDDIDLSTIDANGAAAGHTFSFVAAQGTAFSGAKGQLRWFQDNPAGTVNDKTIVQGDINGDKVADFQIQLAGLQDTDGGGLHTVSAHCRVGICGKDFAAHIRKHVTTRPAHSCVSAAGAPFKRPPPDSILR